MLRFRGLGVIGFRGLGFRGLGLRVFRVKCACVIAFACFHIAEAAEKPKENRASCFRTFANDTRIPQILDDHELSS